MAQANAAIATLMTRNAGVRNLPIFGENVTEDVVDFLERLEIALQFYNLEDNQKARVIPLVLKGRAYTFYFTLEDAIKGDYQLPTDAIRDELNAPELLYRKRQELYSIRQSGDPISSIFLA